ncbi:multidrug transporter [Pseudomonas sp. MIL19]|uniref:multidrug transporter n=1 Tax=Pseudomonas sp. MIL19 TaxID=2976979 RepID=UPI0023646CCC|nr:multidrug transporter [Pseudomonas sp. MIL19]MBU0900701.1 multidrug transporter [Gammaproteobacteria bacterium]MDD2159986.1 multidrug transporter [Pseudomonas sp. MIL19]
MKLFRSTAAALALTTGLLALPAHAEAAQQNTSGDPLYTANAPGAFSMLGDLLIARPLLIGATAIGAVAFVVSLPFTALGGNIDESAEALVLEPGREAFARCLGCTSSADSSH